MGREGRPLLSVLDPCIYLCSAPSPLSAGVEPGTLEGGGSRRSSSMRSSARTGSVSGPARKIQVFEKPVVVYEPPVYRNRGKPAGE